MPFEELLNRRIQGMLFVLCVGRNKGGAPHRYAYMRFVAGRVNDVDDTFAGTVLY